MVLSPVQEEDSTVKTPIFLEFIVPTFSTEQ